MKENNGDNMRYDNWQQSEMQRLDKSDKFCIEPGRKRCEHFIATASDE